VSALRITATLVCLSLGACGGTAPVPPAERDEPPGMGSRTDGKVIGPYATGGSLELRAYSSAEYAGSVNSWLLVGAEEAALVDTQLLATEAAHVVEMVKAVGKPLKWIWVTHGHPDHHGGLEVVARAFPDVPILAHPTTAKRAPEIFNQFHRNLEDFFPGEVASAAVTPQAHEGDTLSVGGVDLRILTFADGEHEFTTALHIPSMQALLCGDLVYNKVHPWLNELKVDGVFAHLDQLEAMAEVETFYPGHGEPFGKGYIPTYRKYVQEFLADVPRATDKEHLTTLVWRRYRDWRTLAGLRFSAVAHLKARREAARGE
jgi:glyoxylase-like metal-dependent hydrolase (beta-lactamase superfamily II)